MFYFKKHLSISFSFLLQLLIKLQDVLSSKQSSGDVNSDYKRLEDENTQLKQRVVGKLLFLHELSIPIYMIYLFVIYLL